METTVIGKLATPKSKEPLSVVFDDDDELTPLYKRASYWKHFSASAESAPPNGSCSPITALDGIACGRLFRIIAGTSYTAMGYSLPIRETMASITPPGQPKRRKKRHKPAVFGHTPNAETAAEQGVYPAKFCYKKFKGALRALAFRSDGRLFAAADDSGTVQVVDIESRAWLRVYKRHLGPVYGLAFSSNKVHIMSGGDDRSLNLWQLSTAKDPILSIPKAHGDYIRCIVASNTPHRWASGGYDGIVKIWNTEAYQSSENNASIEAANECSPDATSQDTSAFTSTTVHTQTATSDGSSLNLLTLNHGVPVEAVRFFSGDMLLVSVGGTALKVWDIMNQQGVEILTLRCHTKTITGVEITADNRLLITVSLDQSLKIHSVDDFTLRHSIHFSQPITKLVIPRWPTITSNHEKFELFGGKLLPQKRCAAQDSDFKTVAEEYFGFAVFVGLRDGRWQMRRNTLSMAELMTATPATSAGEPIITHPKTAPQKLLFVKNDHTGRCGRLENLVRSFQHQAALDHAIRSGRPDDTNALLEEMIQRGALDVSVRGRGAEGIAPLLTFIVNSFNNICNTNRLMEFLKAIVEQNQWILASTDPKIRQLLNRISERITEIIHASNAYREVISIMDVVQTIGTNFRIQT